MWSLASPQGSTNSCIAALPTPMSNSSGRPDGPTVPHAFRTLSDIDEPL
jgi:hypothetical protein